MWLPVVEIPNTHITHIHNILTGIAPIHAYLQTWRTNTVHVCIHNILKIVAYIFLREMT